MVCCERERPNYQRSVMYDSQVWVYLTAVEVGCGVVGVSGVMGWDGVHIPTNTIMTTSSGASFKRTRLV